MFCDPHSSEPDFSDAGYLGLVIWMNYDDALAMYPDDKEALDTTHDQRAIADLRRQAEVLPVGRQEAQAGAHLPDLDQAGRRHGISRSSPRAAS